MALNSFSLIEMRSTCGLAVSAVAVASLAQPEPPSLRSISTSNEVASTCTTLATARSEDVETSIERMASAVCGSIR